jgi:hypothetical protein
MDGNPTLPTLDSSSYVDSWVGAKDTNGACGPDMIASAVSHKIVLVPNSGVAFDLVGIFPGGVCCIMHPVSGRDLALLLAAPTCLLVEMTSCFSYRYGRDT